jgi:hypothetical protein
MRNLRDAASKFQTTAAPTTAHELDDEGSFRAGETLREAGTAASDAMSGAADKIRDSTKASPMRRVNHYHASPLTPATRSIL